MYKNSSDTVPLNSLDRIGGVEFIMRPDYFSVNRLKEFLPDKESIFELPNWRFPHITFEA